MSLEGKEKKSVVKFISRELFFNGMQLVLTIFNIKTWQLEHNAIYDF